MRIDSEQMPTVSISGSRESNTSDVSEPVVVGVSFPFDEIKER
jgi:hypothetical protein